MAGKRIVTDDQKLKAVEIAISGGSPCNYLKSLGAKNPSGMWHNIKHWFSVHNPELYAKIPKKIRGAETPETGTLADAMAGMKDAADKFFDQVPSLKVDGAIRIETPEAGKVEVDDGFEDLSIRSKKTGNRYEWSEDYNLFSVKAHGDELALVLEDWKALLSELPAVAKRLGVEL